MKKIFVAILLVLAACLTTAQTHPALAASGTGNCFELDFANTHYGAGVFLTYTTNGSTVYNASATTDNSTGTGYQYRVTAAGVFYNSPHTNVTAYENVSVFTSTGNFLANEYPRAQGDINGTCYDYWG